MIKQFSYNNMHVVQRRDPNPMRLQRVPLVQNFDSFYRKAKVHFHTLTPLAALSFLSCSGEIPVLQTSSSDKTKGTGEQALGGQVCYRPYATTQSSHAASNQKRKRRGFSGPFAQLVPTWLLQVHIRESSCLS